MRVLLLTMALLLAGCATNEGSGGAGGTTTTTLPAASTTTSVATTTVVTSTVPTSTTTTTPTATTTPTTTTTPTPTSTTPPSGGQTVDIHNFRFIPASVTVPVGTTVTWLNQDGAPHTATALDDAFDSGTLSNGQSFPFTFTEAGTYEYRCDIHTSMRGTVIVS